MSRPRIAPGDVLLTIWAAWEILRTLGRASDVAQAALLEPAARPDPDLSDAMLVGIDRRARALARVTRLVPQRLRCVHRSVALLNWLRAQGLDATLDVGWRAREAHAWVRYGDRVLNDRQDIGAFFASLRARDDDVAASWEFVKAAVRRGPRDDAALRAASARIGDWTGFFRIVKRASCGARISQALAAIGDALPPAVLERSIQLESQRRARLVVAMAELASIVTALEGAGIRYVYLKGLSIATAAGASPLDREMADLDLLVAPADLPATDRLLRGLGYQSDVDFARVGYGVATRSNHNHAEYVSPRGLLPVEIHWRLNEVELCHRSAGAYFMSHAARTSVGPISVATLSRPALTILGALHGARHAWFRLRWIVDLQDLVGAMNGDELRETVTLAEHLGATRAMTAALELMHRVLGTPVPDELSGLLGRHPESRQVAVTWSKCAQGAGIAPARILRLARSLAPSRARAWSARISRQPRHVFSALVLYPALSPAGWLGSLAAWRNGHRQAALERREDLGQGVEATRIGE